MSEEKSEKKGQEETSTRQGEDKAREDAQGGAEEAYADAARRRAPEVDPRQLPPIDFPTFIMSMYTQALLLMGEAAHPEIKDVPQDLDGARQTIDILRMLKEKTTGNLSLDEDRLLENLLHELRMRFVKLVRK